MSSITYKTRQYVQSYRFNRTCLGVWLHHFTTHWPQHKGCILTDMFTELPCKPIVSSEVNINKSPFFKTYSVKLGKKCLNNAEIMNASACNLKLSACTVKCGSRCLVFSCAEPLLGNDEEFWCVTMNWKPLCKSALWVPPATGGQSAAPLRHNSHVRKKFSK